jgi:hypothetical protein
MSSAYSDPKADVLVPTIVTIPLMVTVNKVTLKINPCSTTLLGENMETKHCQHEHESNDPGGGLKEKVAANLWDSTNGGPCITTWCHTPSPSPCRFRGMTELT